MTKERWEQVFNNDDEKLTDQEIKAGWHFCNDFDGLLVGPTSSEWVHCQCFEPLEKVLLSKP